MNVGCFDVFFRTSVSLCLLVFLFSEFVVTSVLSSLFLNVSCVFFWLCEFALTQSSWVLSSSKLELCLPTLHRCFSCLGVDLMWLMLEVASEWFKLDLHKSFNRSIEFVLLEMVFYSAKFSVNSFSTSLYADNNSSFNLEILYSSSSTVAS